jgi:polygalacturonase
VNGAYYYGTAINQAIIDCNAAGGGKVVIPAGGSLNTATMNNGQGVASLPNSLYYSGSINLLSNVNLYLAPGAHVAFVRNPTNNYYPLMTMTYQGQIMLGYAAPIYALNQQNIALTGGGTTSCYDMQDHVGGWTYPTRASGATAGSNNTLNDQDYELVPLTGRINTDIGTVPALVPQVIGGWGSGLGYTMVAPPAGTVMGSGLTNVHSAWQQPELLSIFYCKNLYVAGTEDYSSQFWNTHPFQCTNVLFQNYCSYEQSHLTDDGLDPESCTNMVMENNSISAEDDCTAIKAGRNTETRWPMSDGFGGSIVRTPALNEIIRNTTYNNIAGGSSTISAGSENAAGVFNTFIENCSSGGAGISEVLKFKTTAYRNNVVVGGVYCRNFTLTATVRGIINVDPNYSESVTYPNANVCNETFRDIFIENTNYVGAGVAYDPWLISSGNSRAPQSNLNFRNSTFNCSGSTNTYSGSASGFSSQPYFCNLNASAITMMNSTTHVNTVVNTTPINLLGAPTITVSNSVVTLAADAEYSTGVPADDSSDVWTGPYTFTRNEPVNQVLSRKSLVISGQLDLSTYPLFATPTASGGAGGVVSIYVDRTSAPVACTLSPTGAFTSAAITLTDSPKPFWYMGYHIITLTMHDSNYLNINGAVYNVAYQSGALSQTVLATPTTLTAAAGNTQTVSVAVNASDFLTGGAPVSTIVSVTGNQGTLPTGSYVINPSGTNPLQVSLTAQTGLIYTLTIQTTDSFGNTTTSTVDVIGYSPLPSLKKLLH